MKTAISNLARHRAVLAFSLLALVPFAIGALCIKFTTASSIADVKTIIVALPPDHATSTEADQIVENLRHSSLFDCRVIEATGSSPARPDAFSLAAVSISSSRTGQAPTITIIPGRITSDPQLYAVLVQQVSESATSVGITEVFEAVTGARVKLNVASLTVAGIEGALAQASAALDQAVGGLSPAMRQSGPLISRSRAMLTSYQSTARSLKTGADKLDELARRLATLDVSLGDVRRGAQLSGDELSKLHQVLAQGLPIIRPIDQSLKDSGSPDLQVVATQVDVILQLLDIEADNSAVSDALKTTPQAPPEELSRLLGARVDEGTKIPDFLRLVAARLRYFGTSIEDAKRTFDGAATLFDSAQADLPKAKTAMTAQLDRFKAIVSTLSHQLDTATNQLPDTSADAVDAVSGAGRLQLTGAGTNALSSMLAGAMVLLVSALVIVLAMKNFINASVWYRRLVFVVASAGAGVLTAMTIDYNGRFMVVVAVAAVATAAMTHYFSLQIALLGQWGLATTVVLIGLCLIDRGEIAEHVGATHFVYSTYVNTILMEAAAGTNCSAVATITTTALSGVAWWVLQRKWNARSTDAPHV